MNAQDVLKYGHGTVMRTLNGVPMEYWETGGVCGVWSVKNIVSHLASFEMALADLLRGRLDGGPTPTLDAFINDNAGFNDTQVAARAGQTASEALAEYNAAYAEVASLAQRLPTEVWNQLGVLPWYGAEYDLDDFIVYTFYGHKREHMAQVNVFRDTLN